jgi:hypothetical protein
VTDWADAARRLLDGLTSAPPDGHAGDDGDCRWCPVCQAVAVVRGERPEVTAALADLLGAAAEALRTFSEGGAQPAPAEPEEPAGDPAPPPVVQRIELA